jgi:hypothetical protein
MNQAKRLVRLKVLLDRLQLKDEVSNRDLKLVLSNSEFKQMLDNWEAVKSQKNLEKPKEVKHYEKLLKRATLFENRYESYQTKFNKKLHFQQEFANEAEDSLEKAAEYFNEITTDGFLRTWFDRDIDKDGSLALENMPRAITSKSHFGENGVSFNSTKIRDIKIAAVEDAIEQIKNPSNAEQAMDGFKDAMNMMNAYRNRNKIKKYDF